MFAGDATRFGTRSRVSRGVSRRITQTALGTVACYLLFLRPHKVSHSCPPFVSLKSGQTPLHRAVSNGDLAICTLLLSHGADPNARTAWVRRCLTAACIRCKLMQSVAAAGMVLATSLGLQIWPRANHLAVARVWCNVGTHRQGDQSCVTYSMYLCGKYYDFVSVGEKDPAPVGSAAWQSLCRVSSGPGTIDGLRS